MKSETKVAVFWYVISYSLVATYGRFGGTATLSCGIETSNLRNHLHDIEYNLNVRNFYAEDSGRLRSR